MAAIAEVGAGPADKPVKENEPVKIFFGIFFDGTNNHRLQVLIGKKYREKKGSKENVLWEDEKNISKEFGLDYNLEEQIIKTEEEINQRLERVEILRKTNNEMSSYDRRYIDYEMNEVDDKKTKISGYKSVIDDDINHLNNDLYKKGNTIQNNDFTNIALLEPFYRAKDKLENNEYVYRIYVSGSGTDRELDLSWSEWQKNEKIGAGLGQGSTGVIQKVMDAISCINSKLPHFSNVEDKNITLNFHLFGFSRGATEARVFAHVTNRQKNEKDKKNSLWEFVFKGKNRIKDVIQSGTVIIPAMGLYDTVSSVGVLFKKDEVGNTVIADVQNMANTWSKLHHKNVDDLGLNDLALVNDVYQICALDEYRENFALVPIFESSATKKTEIYIPGCHSDVGGGYSEGKSREITLYAGDVYYPKTPKPYHLMSDDDFKLDNYVSLNNKMWPDQNMRLRLYEIGWVNSSEKGKYNYIPPISFSFDKSTTKGYSYIGLRLMSEYFTKGALSLFSSIDGKFTIKEDLKWLKMDIDSTQKNGKTTYINVEPTKYALLRSKYLHFSAEDYCVNPIKVNSPNYFNATDNEGKKHKCYCRIEYTKDFCKKIDVDYNDYLKKRLEQIENHANQMLM